MDQAEPQEPKKLEPFFLGSADGLSSILASMWIERFFSYSLFNTILVLFAIPFLIGIAGYVAFLRHLPTKKEKLKYVGSWLLIMWMFRWLGLLN